MNKDFILTGPPRSGTTLACHLLNKLPDVVALHEPMNLSHFPSKAQGIDSVHSFIAEMRNSLIREGRALSKVSSEGIPDNPFPQTEGGRRESIVSKQWVTFEKPLSPDFKLIIKHNAHFTYLLPALADRYPCAAVIRNPVSVIASWNTIQAPVAQGLVHVLRTLDPALYAELEAIPNILDRQVRLLDSLFACYSNENRVTIIRYEEMVRSGGRALADLVPEAESLDESLGSRNRSRLYEARLIEEIKERLLAHKGAYLDHYTEAQILEV